MSVAPRIAIASGKGGTGKTTVTVNLARALHAAGHGVQVLDCDVEEPNCHLFLRPTIEQTTPVTVPIPKVAVAKCNLCGRCTKICAFGAILRLGDLINVFPELCHACGACTVVCPEDAISEEPIEIGVVDEGEAGGIRYVGGRLNVGQPRATPIIAAVRDRMMDDRLGLLDVSPGTSCTVVESVRGLDYVVLVGEPTPFGLHDLQLAVETVAELDVPAGVVINRSDMGDDRVRRFADERKLPVLGEIPAIVDVARAQSSGQAGYDAVPAFAARVDALAEAILHQVATCKS